MKYSDFVSDPLGEKARQREFELSKVRKVDEFDKAVKFHEKQDNSIVIRDMTDLDS